MDATKGPPPLFTGLEPGMLVRHPGAPDWGVGQVQSVIGERVTVNFEHAGKQTIRADRVSLEIVG
ncbi:MAG: DUF3553 domain-containing protein [Pseudomonadota bacterium]